MVMHKNAKTEIKTVLAPSSFLSTKLCVTQVGAWANIEGGVMLNVIDDHIVHL